MPTSRRITLGWVWSGSAAMPASAFDQQRPQK
jgi:hypothetical protein